MDRKKNRVEKVRLDKIIGTNIRREREVRKITRDEMAEILDLTTSHLGLIERGERGATPVTIERIVRTFSITIDALFSPYSRAYATKEPIKPVKGVFATKVDALVSNLTEDELEALTHTIKGMVALRKAKTVADESTTKAANKLLGN